VFSQAERGLSEKGLADTLEKAGLKVDRLEITQEANSDATLAVPILAAYIQAHPNLKAIGTQHGGVTGDDRRPEVGLRLRHPRPVALPAGLPAGPAVRHLGQVQDARHLH
jgi:hypothetical protein